MVRGQDSLLKDHTSVVKVASGSGIWGAPGASFANLAGNITSAVLQLPASLQPYLDSTANRLAGATEYLQSTTGLSPTTLYTTAGVIVLLGAVPTVASRARQGNTKSGNMPRYGFSNRWPLSVFGAQDRVPDVRDGDFSYITSADLDDRGRDIPRPYTTQSHIHDPYSTSAPSQAYTGRRQPEDDVILIQHQGYTYHEHFPAYSIGDGKLLVTDVRERVAMILDLSDRQAKLIKLFYKGRRLKKGDIPVRDYGVKDNSELLMVLGESSHSGSSVSSEEASVVSRDERRDERDRSGPHPASPTSPRIGRSGRWGDQSPRDSNSRMGLEVPTDSNRRRAVSRVRTQSPGSAVSAASAPPAAPVGRPGGPIERLNALAAEFNNNWLPLCLEFEADPPRDAKKRGEEHRKLSETIMQKILLKLDEIETSSEEGARARRKALVVEVQSFLNKIDAVAKSSA
ncbi:BAG domain-containing protein [Staphylotrichum tortipilum]|uniref:BAG domain-containing protein n=1 Tax=Staphylotrichum tortipilum TaxID=2831512 RepID=A0AAN6MR09_9PEZI|nr:BAG domain-containing protein [Staphylotrichum longicolle]